MKKAPSIVVDEPTARRLKFASLVTGNLGVIPQEVVDQLVTNEGRGEIPNRLIRGFVDEVAEVVTVTTPAPAMEPPDPRPHIEILHETPKPCKDRTADGQIVGMKTMYSQLGWTFTESGLVIPERRKGFDRLIVLADTTLTNNRIFDACGASFPSWRYVPDLDAGILAQSDERHPIHGIYAIWVEDEVEASASLKNLSADMIAERNPKINTVTFLERGFHECIQYMETGGHLDTRMITLCSGSRSSDGRVSRARWRGDGFEVNWNYRDNRNQNLRAREEVSPREAHGLFCVSERLAVSAIQPLIS